MVEKYLNIDVFGDKFKKNLMSQINEYYLDNGLLRTLKILNQILLNFKIS